MASSAQEQQRLPAAAGLQNLMAMALGSFRREDLNYNTNNNNDRDDHRMPPRYSTNRAAGRDVQVVRTKRGAPTAAATADKKGTMVQALHQELPLHLNNNNNTQQQQQQQETLRYQPPRTIDFHHKSTNSLSGNDGTVTSEITMLNLDFLGGEEDSDDQTVQTTNTNDYDGMDQMQQTMNEMLALAKKSNTDVSGGMLDASHKSSGSLHSLGNISFGVSSVLNHKERLYGSKRNVTEDQQQVVQGGKMDSGEFELKMPSSVIPLHLKNENNGIAHNLQGLPPSLPPRLSSSNNHPQHRPTITTSNTSNSSNGDDQSEEYSAGEIDAIIALKLEVANQRTIIDELSSKLNRALGEKKELEEKMVMSSSMNSRSSHWRRLNRDHDGGVEQQPPSIDEEPNVLSSSLRQLSMSYKTATSTIFSSFSVANPLKEEITPPPSSAQPTPRTTTPTPTTAQSSPISTSWSQAKSGSTTLISTPSQQQQQQQQRSQSLTIPNNSKDSSKIQLQLLELQTTLATQMESSKRKEREWMSLCEKLQSENQRLSDENRQWKKNSVGSCSNLSGLSRLSGRNGAASGSSSGGGGSIRSLQSSDFSSRQGRITEGGIPLREEKKQDSVAEGKEEEDDDDDECSSTQNSTGDQESWKKSLEVEPIFVRTKI